VAVGEVGALGKVAGITDELATELGPVPMELVAVTENV
jgi:hypothetical protein